MIINIYANHCKVEGTPTELRWLRDLLSFSVPGAEYTAIYRRHQWDGKKRFFNVLTRILSIGHLDYVLENAGDVKIECKDLRKFDAIDYTLPKMNLELRDYQESAVLKCLRTKNCLIQAATNAGKTAIFSTVLKKIYPAKSIILIHRSEILWQMKDMIEAYTGLEVGFITADNVLIKPITIGMIQTLLNRLGADQEITDFFEDAKCIVVDEVHHAVNASITSLLAASKAVWRLGCSGTIPEADTFNGMLVRQYIGSVVFRITNDELIEKGVSAKPQIFIYEIDSSSILKGVFDEAKRNLTLKLGEYSSQQLMKEVYRLTISRGIINNPERNGKVVDIIKGNKNKSTLIVVDLLEHGTVIETILEKAGIDAKFISGESEIRKSALDSFKAGKLHVLISTNIIDEGLDVPLISCLVLLAGKKSRRQLLQRVGRSLRKKPGENIVKIYDFADYGSRYLQAHTKERLQIYKDEKFTVTFV